MSCKLKNIDNMKLKFTDPQKTTINVKEPTNNFILKNRKVLSFLRVVTKALPKNINKFNHSIFAIIFMNI